MGAAGFAKQAALAEATGISQTTVSRLINDEYKPKLEQVDRIAKSIKDGLWALGALDGLPLSQIITRSATQTAQVKPEPRIIAGR